MTFEAPVANDGEVVERVVARILVDNNVSSPDFTVEHGFSVWIEADGDVVLFDTGQGRALALNARRMGVDLGAVTRLVLSHGHFDHSGGIPAVLSAAPGAEVFLPRGYGRERFSRSTGKTRSIGLGGEARDALARLPRGQLNELGGPTRVRPGVWATGPVPRAGEPEGADDNLFLGGGVPDGVEEDQALFVRTRGGVILFIGCGHAGLANTLDNAARLSPGPIRAVIGGFHLSRAGRPRWEIAEEALRRRGVELAIPCHCTGPEATAFFVEKLGPRCRPGRTGEAFVF